MESLSYFSNLDELINASDEKLRSEITSVSPKIVTEYVFHLREIARQKDRELIAAHDRIRELDALIAIPNNPPPLYPTLEPQPHGSVQGSEPTVMEPVNGETLERRLRVGDKIIARGYFVEGTSKFTINLHKNDALIDFHLDFRPPHTIVMNNKTHRGWAQEIRDTYPQLDSGTKFIVEILCDTKEFRVFFNGSERKCFPYRAPLEEITRVWFVHGSHGNMWYSLETPLPFLTTSTALAPRDHRLREPLKVGDKISAIGRFAKGTQKFNINLIRERENYIDFHLDFRPPKTIVMNTSFGEGWMKEIRDTYPKLNDNQVFLVEILCDTNAFRVFFDGIERKCFPYRSPLEGITGVNLVHGSGANGWFWLHLPPQLDSSPGLPV